MIFFALYILGNIIEPFMKNSKTTPENGAGFGKMEVGLQLRHANFAVYIYKFLRPLYRSLYPCTYSI